MSSRGKRTVTSDVIRPDSIGRSRSGEERRQGVRQRRVDGADRASDPSTGRWWRRLRAGRRHERDRTNELPRVGDVEARDRVPGRRWERGIVVDRHDTTCARSGAGGDQSAETFLRGDRNGLAVERDRREPLPLLDERSAVERGEAVVEERRRVGERLPRLAQHHRDELESIALRGGDYTVARRVRVAGLDAE